MVLRLAIIAGGVCMMVPGSMTDIAGLAVVAAIVAFQFIMGKKQKGTPAAA